MSIYTRVLARLKKIIPSKIPSTVQMDEIVFYTPSELCAWRARTLFKKEPATIAWIDSFSKDDIFWDVGANIGAYSMYAGVRKNLKVYAFEPSPFNFHVLARNIYLNNKSDNISAFCLALTDHTVIDYLNLKSVNEGAAHTSFKNSVNEFGVEFSPEYSHSTLGFRADDFVQLYNLPVPNHIKIDVDGAEQLVIAGAEKILLHPQLKSILIELNTELSAKEREIFNTITMSGFLLESSDHPDGDQRLSNYIFRRR